MTQTSFDLEYTYSALPDVLYAKVTPKKFPNAKLVLFNRVLADELGLFLNESSDDVILNKLLGDQLPTDAMPLAQAYAGHQYGHFTQLGDGRAFLLGEHITPNNQRIDLHLKGAGQTTYSRNGDGNAALGPMLREYIVSEAMHHLGIPTTRSLAVITTGEDVWRDSMQQGAILVRVASSHIRVGTFQYAAVQSKTDALPKLLHYTLQRHFPELLDSDNPAQSFLQKMVEQQAHLITEWMRVGFIHGVMNTDNMAVSGETIDYGPCAFMDSYHPGTVFSAIDAHGRYAFGQQAPIAQWNIARLAESLLPLLHTDQATAITIAEDVVGSFKTRFDDLWLSMMKRKIGLDFLEQKECQLINDLLSIMETHQLDYTHTFFDLTYHLDKFKECNSNPLHEWLQQRQQMLDRYDDSIHSDALMRAANPVVIPRNHQVEKALAAADGNNRDLVTLLLNATACPYELNPTFKDYWAPPQPDERVYQTFCGT